MIGREGVAVTIMIHGMRPLEEPKDGYKWHLSVNGLVVATITLQKYVNFSIYVVDCTTIGRDGEISHIPPKDKSHKRFIDAVFFLEHLLRGDK